MATIAEMKVWFSNRFETATESVFHDSGEGGFQYPTGKGPVNVLVELEQRFPNARAEDVKKAASELEDEGPWVDFSSLDDEAAGLDDNGEIE